MSDIFFESPISFKLDILEIENRIPSIKVGLNIAFHGPNQKVSIDQSLWIECIKLSDFIKQLSLTNFESASLKDIGEIFKLEIAPLNEEYIFSFIVNKSNKSGSYVNKIEYKSIMDADTFFSIKRSFNDFPVWW